MMTNLKKKVTAITTAAGIATLSISAFALDSETTTAMDTGFTAVKNDALAGLAKVAPIALTVFGTFLVWKYGKRFFASIAK